MAFLQEPEPQPFMRVPVATAGLIAALVVAHIVRVLSPLLTQQAIIRDYAFFPTRYSHAYLAANNVSPGSFWERAVPFVSYAFLHGSFTHLAVNCVWLLPFGSIVTRRLGAVAFFALFVLCAIAGALAHLMTNWGSPEPVVGASAAISGMMGVGFRIVAGVSANDIHAFTGAVGGPSQSRQPLAPLWSSRLLLWSGVWLAINVVAGLTGLGAGLGPHVIAWQAHIGGYVAGLLLAGPFDALARRRALRITPA